MTDDAIATITLDPTTLTCEFTGCHETDRLVTVTPDTPGREDRTVCGNHLVDYLERLS